MEGDGSLSIPSPESLPHNTHKKKVSARVDAFNCAVQLLIAFVF